MRLAHVGDGKQTTGSMQIVRAALLVLGLAEIGEHVIEAPAGIAELAPMIEILMLPTHI
jgi:hypothetical protein